MPPAKRKAVVNSADARQAALEKRARARGLGAVGGNPASVAADEEMAADIMVQGKHTCPTATSHSLSVQNVAVAVDTKHCPARNTQKKQLQATGRISALA